MGRNATPRQRGWHSATGAETPAQRVTDSLQLYQRLAKAEAERDLLLDQVADLRTRLDAEAAERRKLVAVLTDRREPSLAPAQTPTPWPRRALRWLVKQHV